MPLSLRFRITLLTVAIIAIVIVVVSAAAYNELKEALAGVPDLSLRSTIDEVRDKVKAAQSQPAQNDTAAAIERITLPETVDLLVWSRAGDDAAIKYASSTNAPEWIAAIERKHAPEVERERLFTLTHGNQLFRVAWSRFLAADTVFSVAAIVPVHYAQHELGEFLRLLLILGASLLLAAAILAALSVFLTIRPIGATARRLDGVTDQNLGAEHLAGISPPKELTPFVESVRSMLARVNDGMESQRRFVAEASHELRTPLALAKSTIQAVQLGSPTIGDYRKALDELLEDINRLSHLVRQLLDLAKLEKTDDEPSEEVAIAPMLQSLACQYSRGGDGRISCDVPDDGLTVKGNSVELESLFGNLIENAIKHGPEAGPIRIQAAADGSECLITVHDEGGQIPPGQIDRLFDKFYRVDASRSRATGGSGLGLAIAKRITLRHGGAIGITSTPGEGTDVSVRLPLANAPA